MRIMIVEDHAPTRQEMRNLLDREEEFQVVAEAGTGEEAIEKAGLTEPDVIVMDIVLPKINGVEATRAIVRKLPDVRVLALSNYSGHTLVQAVLQAGGMGFVRKERAFTDLIPAIRAVAAGKQYVGEASDRTRPVPDGGVRSPDGATRTSS